MNPSQIKFSFRYLIILFFVLITGSLAKGNEPANPNIVFIADVPEAMTQFEDYQLVTLDGGEKIIYEGFLDNNAAGQSRLRE